MKKNTMQEISNELLIKTNEGLSKALISVELENTRLRYGLELLITDYEFIASKYLRSKAVKKEKKEQLLDIIGRAKSLLNSEPNPEECDARNDHQGTKAGNQNQKT